MGQLPVQQIRCRITPSWDIGVRSGYEGDSIGQLPESQIYFSNINYILPQTGVLFSIGSSPVNFCEGSRLTSGRRVVLIWMCTDNIALQTPLMSQKTLDLANR